MLQAKTRVVVLDALHEIIDECDQQLVLKRLGKQRHWSHYRYLH